MGRGNNQPETRRDFFFTLVGGNTLSGHSSETPVADPQTAIARTIALIPAPSSSDPASINASVTGGYFTGVTIPDFVKCNSEFASIITTDAFCVQCGSSQDVEWSGLVNLASDGICVKIDGVSRVSSENNLLIVGTDGDVVNQTDTRISPTQLASVDNVGFLVTGICSEIFCSVVSGVIGAEGGTLIKHEATSSDPVEYIVGNAEFFEENQTFIDFNPPNATDQAVINVSSIQPNVDAVSTAGSVAYRARNGRLIVDNEVVSVESLLVADADSRAALDIIVGFGDLLLSDTSQADFSSEILVGDITVEDTAILTAAVLNHVGDITVGSTAKLNADTLVHIGTVSPSDPDAGPIDGIIANKRYGARRVLDVVVLEGVDTTIQNPAGLGAPLQIKFGPVQVNPEVSVSALGGMTVHVKNEYFFKAKMQAGRVNNGGVADLHFRLLVDGDLSGEQVYFAVDGAGDDAEIVIDSDPLDLDVGQVVTVEMLRSITGMNDGSLFPIDPAQAGWAVTPSASVTVVRRT